MINGTKIAQKIIRRLQRRKAPHKTLAAILVGSDSASLSFLRQKAFVAKQLGVSFYITTLPSTLSQRVLEQKIRHISKDEKIGGIIVQLPLPKKYNRIGVLNAIGIEKDIDVLNGETSRVLAPAAGALSEIFKEIKFYPKGKRAVIIGSGLLVGQPVTQWLMHQTKQLTILNRGALDSKVLREADVIISGTGVPHLVRGSYIKKNAVVIDYGYGKLRRKLYGDIHIPSVSQKTSWYTPTPGGTGPIVVAKLLENFFMLLDKR